MLKERMEGREGRIKISRERVRCLVWLVQRFYWSISGTVISVSSAFYRPEVDDTYREHQIGLYQGANMGLLKTVFEVNLGLFGGGGDNNKAK
jgi:hypothetical protein